MSRWLALGALWALAGCNDRPLSWDSLVSRKITEQYPTYRVEQSAPGQLQVHRPGLSPVAVDLADIALRCQRGQRDCNTATDQLLLDLR